MGAKFLLIKLIAYRFRDCTLFVIAPRLENPGRVLTGRRMLCKPKDAGVFKIG